jgi:two-component system cell cycle sensor histidine kinase/response regulator CckA
MSAQRPPTLDALRKRGLEPLKLAALVAVLYAGFSSIYIVYSSWLAAHLVHTPRDIRMVETGKGILFVLITAGLLSAIIFHWSRRSRRQEELLVNMERRSLAASYNAALAHDLNNLLMTFNALLGEMRDLEGTNAFLRGTREQLERGIESLGALSRRLAASAANRETIRNAPVNLRDTLSRAAALVRKHPDLQGRTLTLPDLPAISLMLDQDLLVHAFMNLVINAAQAMTRGGRIEVRASIAGDEVHLEVHDDGPGVPADIAERIFEAGFTTKQRGTGLGLLSARHFAETCGGGIQLLHSPLGGALFRITIPRPEKTGA